ncbi:MAG: DMT family transporter [Planctomycetes bacterium]|nr:DMT family transporter [Planctomycetota bacterium]
MQRPPALRSPNAASPYLWMLLAALNFSTMAALGKAVGTACDWSVVATARSGVMLILIIGLLIWAGVPLHFRGPAALWVRSLAGSMGLLCTFYAITRLHISDALTFMNMYPLWIAILSWAVFGERPGRGVGAALAVSALGVILIARPQFSSNWAGMLAGVGNSFFMAVAMLGLHKAGAALDTRSVVAHFSIVSTATAALVALARGLGGTPAFVLPPLVSTEAVLLLGVGVAGTVGQLAMTRAYALGKPTRVALVALAQLVFGIIIDLLVWNRRFEAASLLGIFLVAGPTAWLMTRGGGEPPSRLRRLEPVLAEPARLRQETVSRLRRG